MVDVFSLLSVVLYIAATLAISMKLLDPHGPNPKVYLSLGTLAVICHILLLTNSLYFFERVDFSLPNVVLLVASMISAAVTTIALKYRSHFILPVVYSFTAALIALFWFIPKNQHVMIDNSSFALVSHITFALLAYGILVIATLYSFQVNYINYKLKSKNLTAVSHLPPLMQVEQQLFAIMMSGTVCLLTSQLIGMMFIDNFFAKENIHKTVLSVLALVMYLTILFGHYRLGWRGHRVMVLSVLATGILTLSYFGSRFVKEVLLS
ncbi:inner membrane protein YpjD [Thalassotalea maritima]|uniref:cytochrome C assembly family protein n=1 Tax=Thalassotalea maritima TaxID=3242416 RepID=UPI0035270BB0